MESSGNKTNKGRKRIRNETDWNVNINKRLKNEVSTYRILFYVRANEDSEAYIFTPKIIC